MKKYYNLNQNHEENNKHWFLQFYYLKIYNKNLKDIFNLDILLFIYLYKFKKYRFISVIYMLI